MANCPRVWSTLFTVRVRGGQLFRPINALGDKLRGLVTVATANGLFTHDFDKGFSAYVAMLKTGLPGVRNVAGGHGDGLVANAVTAGIARFAINLTASNIVLLGDSYAALKAEQQA